MITILSLNLKYSNYLIQVYIIKISNRVIILNGN